MLDKSILSLNKLVGPNAFSACADADFELFGVKGNDAKKILEAITDEEGEKQKQLVAVFAYAWQATTLRVVVEAQAMAEAQKIQGVS